MTVSQFPEIQPFGPGPASHNAEPAAEAKPAEVPASAPVPDLPAEQNRSNLAFAIFAGISVGFLLGYLVSRYEQAILRQTKLDEFLEYAQQWIHEQGPKI